MTQKFTAEEVRARFETWVSSQPWFAATIGLTMTHDAYIDPCINSRWQGWRTAYADTLSKPADSGRVDAKEYLDNCVNALDHIARTARNCRVTSKRLTWIASRAESAINSDDAWRDAPVPQNGASALMRARVRIKELEAALAAQGQGDQIDGMQAALPKPRMPIGSLGLEDFCFCNNEVSLQAIAGGGSSEGYLGSVRLKIDGKFVTYIREPASPAGVPDGEDDAAIDRAAHVLQEVIAENDGEPSEMAHDQVRRILAAYAAPSAPEGDGGGE